MEHTYNFEVYANNPVDISMEAHQRAATFYGEAPYAIVSIHTEALMSVAGDVLGRITHVTTQEPGAEKTPFTR